MAARPKTTIGTVKCSCCNNDVPVRQSDTGTINFSCPWCDLPAYAKAGTQAHKIVMQRMTPLAQGEGDKVDRTEKPAGPATPPAPEQKTTPPAAKSKATIFG